MDTVARQHLQWLEMNAPGITEAFKRSQHMLGAEQGIMDKIFGFAQSFTQYKAQKDILKTQMDRAKKGQPPLNTSQYGMPPIRVETGVSPEIRKEIGGTLKTSLMIGGGLVGLTLLILLLRRRGRQ